MLAVEEVAMQIMHLMKAVYIYATCSAHKKYINFTHSILRVTELKYNDYGHNTPHYKPMLFINTSCCLKCSWGNWWHGQLETDIISYHMFPWINSELLIYTLEFHL